jgi:hypothetical protein
MGLNTNWTPQFVNIYEVKNLYFLDNYISLGEFELDESYFGIKKDEE